MTFTPTKKEINLEFELNRAFFIGNALERAVIKAKLKLKNIINSRDEDSYIHSESMQTSKI